MDMDPLAGVLGNEVRAALLVLPVPERAAIMLAFFGGLTYREVAVLLHEPEGTVKSRIRSGLRRMRSMLTVVEAHSSPNPYGLSLRPDSRRSELGCAAERQQEAGGDDASRGQQWQRTGQ
jgi:DNA-binding NarL/FixJ family response regulator